MTPTLSKAVEAGAAAMDAATFGYRIELVRLVDGVHTYEATIRGQPPREFEEQDEAYEWVRGFISHAKTLAVLRAALPVIGAELAETAWLHSKQGATHDQIAEAIRAKLAEIMGEV